MKYILKKAYPGHTLGETHSSDKSTEWLGTYFYDAHPEFWQKVEKVDYEVLKITPSKNNLFRKSGFMSISHSETDYHYWDIYSVKRLSDGEIFTVGDNMNCSNMVIYNARINSFSVSDLLIVNFTCGYASLNLIEKRKTPLFTTEDGVKIFEGTYYFSVKLSKMDIRQGCNGSVANNGLFKIFSTKEKAEEYVLLNKPCLSLTEISGYYKHLLHFNNGNSMGLRNLVKSKL